MDPNQPIDEAARLRTLEMYQIMDTQAERAFDELTQLAATICKTPISLVSLVDDSRQWFKSRHGIDASETPRDQAFCAHVIVEDEVMVVPDASLDARFAANPLVTGEPNIRFYAGAPLQVADGSRLGTLCVIDRVPRELSSDQLEALSVLRNAVVANLELRKAQEEFRSLSRLVPICAWCKAILANEAEPDAAESWMPLHEFIADRVPVTHGMCPSCTEQHTG